MTKVNNVIEVRKNQYVVEFLCDYCHRHTLERKSHFDRKKNHFCCQKCYSKFREEIMLPEEQNSYGTGHSKEERAKRRKARSELNHYLRDNHIERKPCEICGGKAEAHHDDYNKPLDVRWLCFKHHRGWHKIHENPELLGGEE